MNAGVIAVIDDNKTWIESVTEVLTDAGFEVHSATNGEQAFDLLDSIRPNLIILDVHIPGTSGLRILSDYRGHDRATPILVVSADDRAQIRNRAMSDGATSFLKKPIPSPILIRAVRRFVLHKSRGDTPLPGSSARNQQTDSSS